MFALVILTLTPIIVTPPENGDIDIVAACYDIAAACYDNVLVPIETCYKIAIACDEIKEA